MVYKFQKTLAEELGEIRVIPDSARVDRYSAYQNILEDWRKRSMLVECAIQRKASVAEEFKYLSDKYMGWRRLLPETVDRVDRQRIDNLDELVGPLGLYQPDVLLGNPVSAAVGLGALVLVPSEAYEVGRLATKGKPFTRQTRRQFLQMAGALGLLGAMAGGGACVDEAKRDKSARYNAEYIQKVIDATYHPK